MNEITPKVYKPGDPIPLQLECTVNGTVIYYDRLRANKGGYPGYLFYIFDNISKDDAEEKVKILIDRILDDNDESEHGVSWRTTSFEYIGDDCRCGTHIFEWHYRVRDTY